MCFPPFPKMLDFSYAQQMSKKLKKLLWKTANGVNLKVVFDYPADRRFFLHSCWSCRQKLCYYYCLNCVIRKDDCAVLRVCLNNLELV